MTDATISRTGTVRLPGLFGPGVIAGLVGGMGMAVWQMIDAAATGRGFWTPLNLCMASFVYRGEAAMIEQEMMKTRTCR
jgi:hypothetical protein